jgi:hypothetical protein
MAKRQQPRLGSPTRTLTGNGAYFDRIGVHLSLAHSPISTQRQRNHSAIDD